MCKSVNEPRDVRSTTERFAKKEACLARLQVLFSRRVRLPATRRVHSADKCASCRQESAALICQAMPLLLPPGHAKREAEPWLHHAVCTQPFACLQASTLSAHLLGVLRPKWLWWLYLLPVDVVSDLTSDLSVWLLPVLRELLTCLSRLRAVPRLVPAALPPELLAALRPLTWWRIRRPLMLVWLASAPITPVTGQRVDTVCVFGKEPGCDR